MSVLAVAATLSSWTQAAIPILTLSSLQERPSHWQIAAATTNSSSSSSGVTASRTSRTPTRPIQVLDQDDDNSVSFHFIVSSECSSYQLWETLTLIHSAEAVRQCGHLTWIISGCLPEDKLHHGKGKSGASSDILTPSVMQQHVNEHFPPFDQENNQDCSRLQPQLHFTPDFSNMSVYGGEYADGKKTRYFHNPKNGKEVRSSYGNRYVFNNKPNGLLHWAKEQQQKQPQPPNNEAIVLIDPDFLFLNRFHLAKPDMSVVGQKDANSNTTIRDIDLVYPGRPAAASYGLGAQWLDFDLVSICGQHSHCTNTTNKEVHKYYSAGPPYVIHRADVLDFAAKWSELVPPTYDVYPLLYAEMYAYSMAAAHLQLKHNLINNLFTGCMVSWPSPKHRWGKINPEKQRAEEQATEESAQLYRTQLAQELADSNSPAKQEQPATSCFQPHLTPPPLLHYCERYFVQATPQMKQHSTPDITYWFFAKRRVPHHTILACDHSNRFLPMTSTQQYERMAGGHVEWNSLAVCAITRALNFARDVGCTRKGSIEKD